MKAVRTALVITALALALASGAGAQQPHHGESFTLNTTLNPAQDHEYAAGWCIDLLPGFQSQPQAGSTTQLRIDPFYNTLDDHGLPYNTPPDHDISGRLGFYPMDFRVNDCGAATISMPLEFPEGINGMTPHLSLEYNSQAGNGIMGLGWSLGGMSKISRVPYTFLHNDQNHSVTFTNEDQLSLDGNILKKGIYQDAECYYPEIYDYSVVIPQNGGFKVLRKDGTVAYYGLDENNTSRYYIYGIPDYPIEWHLSRVEDANGNSMDFFYTNNTINGSFHPDSILYGGNPQQNIPYSYKIEFKYSSSPRGDTQIKHFAKSSHQTGSSFVDCLLTELVCYNSGDKLSLYKLEYDNLNWNIKALRYVCRQYFYSPDMGGDRYGYNLLVPTFFQWRKTDYKLDFDRVVACQGLNTIFDRDHEWYQHSAFLAMFETTKEDSCAKYEGDLVHLLTHDANILPRYKLNIFRNTNRIDHSGQEYSFDSNGYNISVVNSLINDGRDIVGLFPVDTDLDGISEILCVYRQNQALMLSLFSKGDNGLFGETYCKTVSYSGSTTISDLTVADLTGDGLPDLFFLLNNKPAVLVSSYETPFCYLVTYNNAIAVHHRVIVGDFDNDKRCRVLILQKQNDNLAKGLFFRVEYNETAGTYYFAAPEGTLYDELTDMARYYHQMESDHCTRLCQGDFNGDGRLDIVLFCNIFDSAAETTDQQWRFYFSKGKCRFTNAQVYDTDSVVSDDSFNSIDENSEKALVDVADFDKDGCDDISIAKVEDRHHGEFDYHHLFRRVYLIHPTKNGIKARKVRNTRLEWINNPNEPHGGHNDTLDISIDSIRANTTYYAWINPFLHCMGNTKGTSPTEILYMRVSGNEEMENIYHYNCPIGLSMTNSGCLENPPTDLISGIVTSTGERTEISYRPLSYQKNNCLIFRRQIPISRDIQPVVPCYSFLNIVDSVCFETEDYFCETFPKKWRTEKYRYSNAWYHTRGRGFIGFGNTMKLVQGQESAADIQIHTDRVVNGTHYLLVPTMTVRKVGEGTEAVVFDSTVYTHVFQSGTDFSSDLGQIPNGVFAPYIASTVTVRNDGTPQKYEKTVTERDGYGNITSTERRFGNDTTSYPYYEKTVTTYDHSVGSIRWLLGVPKSKTTTQRLVGTTADKVIQQATWQNDMVHGRHTSMTREPNTNKWLSETYGYDDFGHLTSVTRDIGNGNSRTDIFSYSNDGRFMTMQTDAAGHTTHCYHNDKTGLLDSVTDPNGLTTRYRYDILWNLIQTEYPSGVKEDQCMMWVDTCHAHTDTWHPDTPNFGAPVYFTWSKRSGERESVVFYDQHRRKLREVGGTMDGKKVYVDYRYHDVTGLMTEVSAPYYPGDGETPQFTQYTYDYLDRCIRTDRPDGAYSTHSYDGLTETVRGFDGQRRKLTRNCAGIVTKVSDYGNSTGSAVNINYTLYGDGSVKTSKVGGDNATLTSYTYDVNRNPVTVNDPSLGLLTYDYDGFGDLVGSVTPRDISQYSYDVLGRITARTGYDGTSSWMYDNGFIGEVSQTVYTPTAGPSVTERFTYDRLGRLTEQAQTIGTQEEWVFEYGYDALGRFSAITYPSGKTFRWHHDRNGFMDKVCDAADNSTVWQATATDRWGNTTEFTGGGISVSYGYDPVTGLPTGISARKGGQTLFGQACQWLITGNLEWRTDTTLNLKETFTYDRFNRLLKARAKNLAGTATHATQEVSFNTKGNIIQKDGVGGYAYGGDNPYAVTALGPDEDVAGILTGQTVAYTPFDKVGTVSQDGRTLSVDYGIDRQRVTQTLNDGSSRRTKRYFTPLYETVTENGVTKKLHYLSSSSGIFAIFVTASTGGGTMYYTLKDHQGSLAAVVHDNSVERLSYDPWGRRRNTTNFGYSNVSHTLDRGYTLHEHYDGFDLINMNGRLYDPILGRMLSPDIVIQDEQSSQAYNRYSYCFNNPLRFTDPSGYWAEDYWDPFSKNRPDLVRFKIDDRNGRLIQGVSYDTREAQGMNDYLPFKYDFGFGDPDASSVLYSQTGPCLEASLGEVSRRLGGKYSNDNANIWHEKSLEFHNYLLQKNSDLINEKTIDESTLYGNNTKYTKEYIEWTNNGKYNSYEVESFIDITNIPSAFEEGAQVIMGADLDEKRGHAGILNSYSHAYGYEKFKIGDPSPKRIFKNTYYSFPPNYLRPYKNKTIFFKIKGM